MAKRMNKYQAAYVAAKSAFEAAERSSKTELVTSGLQERFDTLPESAYESPEGIALSAELDAVVDKWHVVELRKALAVAETNLIEWSLSLAETLKPSAREDVALLRARIHLVKPQLIDSAMRLPA